MLPWLIGAAGAMLQHKNTIDLCKLSAELFFFSSALEGPAQCFKSSVEPFKGSIACFETNAQLIFLINGHIRDNLVWIILFWIICSHFYNTLRLFNASPNFIFTTSEEMLNYYLLKEYIRVASRVA